MRRLVNDRLLQRIAAAIIGLSIIAAVAGPASSPARGDGTVTVAVDSFTDEAGASASVATALSSAAYQGVSSTSGFSARGGGPLPAQTTLTSDAFIDALHSAARAGAQDLLMGSVIQSSGGSVYYRLSLYRVAPVTFISSQVFSQAYPSNAQTLSSGFAANLASLSTPRHGTGTIYSMTNGATADVGTVEGFSLGDRFTVTRNGQRMASAQIATIHDDFATLTFSDETPGYQPAVGDTLVSANAMAPIPPAPPSHSSFNPFAILVAAGATLAALGHHGQPGTFCASCHGTPSPSTPPFAVNGGNVTGTFPSETINILFNQQVSAASQLSIAGNTNFAFYTLQQNPSPAPTTPPAPLSSLGNVTFDTTGTIMSLVTNGSVGTVGETFFICFTSSVMSTGGSSLPGTECTTSTFAIVHRDVKIRPKKVGPVAPGPGVKPAVPNVPPNPKPHPDDPRNPH